MSVSTVSQSLHSLISVGIKHLFGFNAQSQAITYLSVGVSLLKLYHISKKTVLIAGRPCFWPTMSVTVVNAVVTTPPSCVIAAFQVQCVL